MAVLYPILKSHLRIVISLLTEYSSFSECNLNALTLLVCPLTHHFVCFCVHFTIGSSFFGCGHYDLLLLVHAQAHTVNVHYSICCQTVKQNGIGTVK